MAPRNFDTFDPSSLQQTEDDIITTHIPSTHTTTNTNTPQLQQTPQQYQIINNEEKEFKPKIVWKNVLIFLYLHIAAIYGIYLCAYAKYQTLAFGKIELFSNEN